MKEQVEGVDPHLMRLYPHLEVYTPTGSLKAAVRLRSNNRDRILTKWVWGISPTHSHAFSVISSMVTQEVARLGADNVAVRAFPDAYLASGKELSIISLVIDNHPPGVLYPGSF